MPHALVRVIVQVYMCNFNVARWERFRIDAKPVILGGDFHLIGQQVLHRVVGTVMPEFQFERFPAKSQAT